MIKMCKTASWLMTWCGLITIFRGSEGAPFDPHRQFLRSVDNEFDKTNLGLCSTLELDSNITSIDLMGRTTALFKVSEYDEKSANVTMLEDLKERFTNSGYTSLNFVVIIPPNGNNHSHSIITTPNTRENISVIVDNEDLEHLVSDSVTVIDGCGVIVYTIFSPWSSLEYPYVKAAILSTMFDQTCGVCEKAPKHQFKYPLYDRKPSLILDIDSSDKGSRQIPIGYESRMSTMTTASGSTTPEIDDEADSRFIIPLRVILPVEHVHENNEDDPNGPFIKYNYFVLKTDDGSYHGHLDTDPGEVVKIYHGETTVTPTTTTQEDVPSTESSTTEQSQTTMTEDNYASIEPLLSLTGMASNSLKSFSLGFSTNTINDLQEDGATTEPTPYYVNQAEEKFKVRKKYRFLNVPEMNFNELELEREKVKEFITNIQESSSSSSNEDEEVNIARVIDEHYNHMIQWLDFIL